MPSPLAILGGPPLRSRPFPAWPVFDDRERAQLEDVLTSSSWGGYPSPNRKATEFAAAFAAYQGARFAIPTTSSSPQSPSPRRPMPPLHAWRVPYSPTSAPPTHASIPARSSASSRAAPRQSSPCITARRSPTSTHSRKFRARIPFQSSRTAHTSPAHASAIAASALTARSDVSVFNPRSR